MPSSSKAKAAMDRKLESVGTFLFGAPMGMIIASSYGMWRSQTRTPTHLLPAAASCAIIQTVIGLAYIGLHFMPSDKSKVPPPALASIAAAVLDAAMGIFFAVQFNELKDNYISEQLMAGKKAWEELQGYKGQSSKAMMDQLRGSPKMLYALEDAMQKYGSPFGLSPECTPFDSLLDPTKFPWWTMLVMLVVMLWIHFATSVIDAALKFKASKTNVKKSGGNSISRSGGSHAPVIVGSKSSSSKSARSARQ